MARRSFPDHTRERAIERMLAGDSPEQAARGAGCGAATARRWMQAYRDAARAELGGPPIRGGEPIRDRIIEGSGELIIEIIGRLRALAAGAGPEQIGDLARALRAASEIALDWRDGRRGMQIQIDARQQQLILGELSDDELERRIAAAALLLEGPRDG